MKGAVVDEVPVEITVNGQSVLQTTCSPTLLEAFGAGRLLAEGYVHDRSDLRSITVEGNDHLRTIRVELPLPAAQAGEGERRHRAQHGCGILYYLECAPDTVRRPWPGEAPELRACFPSCTRSYSRQRETIAIPAACTPQRFPMAKRLFSTRMMSVGTAQWTKRSDWLCSQEKTWGGSDFC
jgi:hypothetical protein